MVPRAIQPQGKKDGFSLEGVSGLGFFPSVKAQTRPLRFSWERGAEGVWALGKEREFSMFTPRGSRTRSRRRLLLLSQQTKLQQESSS